MYAKPCNFCPVEIKCRIRKEIGTDVYTFINKVSIPMSRSIELRVQKKTIGPPDGASGLTYSAVESLPTLYVMC